MSDELFYCDLVTETEMAILIDYDDEKIWLPKSQIDYGYEKGSFWVEVPEWLAEEKEMI